MRLDKIQNRAGLDHPIVRNSSFELLRIIAMLGIVASYFAYGNFSFPKDSIMLNGLWIQLIIMGGKLGVHIFVLISGYFLIESGRIKIRKLAGMWAAMLFYSVMFCFAFVMSGAVSFSGKEALYAFMPLTKSRWWFLTVYFMLYLLHPYINTMLKNLSKSEYEKMLLIMTFCWSVVPTFTNSFLASDDLIWFIYLYSISGYIRLWADDFGSRKYIWLSVMLIALNFLIVIIFDVIGLKVRMFAEHPLHLYNTQMLPTLLIPVCILMGFKHLNMKYSRFINVTASATIGVYMIHTDKFFSRYMWDEIFRINSFQNSPYLIPYSIAVILVIYVSCTLIELTRSKIFRALSCGRLS